MVILAVFMRSTNHNRPNGAESGAGGENGCANCAATCVAESMCPRVAILYGGEEEFNQFPDNRGREVVMCQTLA